MLPTRVCRHGDWSRQIERGKILPKQVFLALPEQVQDAILLSAAKVVDEKGFRMTTLDDVAEAAGIKPETMEHYFESKNDLFASVLGRAIQYFNEVYIDIGAESVPFWNRVEKLFASSVTKVRPLGAYLSIYLNIGGSGLPELAQATFDRIEGRAALFFQNLVLAGVQEGVVRDDIDVAAMANHFQEVTRILISRRAHPLYRARSKAYFAEIHLTDDGDVQLVRRMIAFLKTVYGK